MKIPAAIIAFSQSEKIKSAIIWTTQILELSQSLSMTEQQGAEKMIRAMIDMIAQEIHVARNMTRDDSLDDIERHMDMAQVMINSQMSNESGFHLTQALTQVTSLAQRSMTVLKENGLL